MKEKFISLVLLIVTAVSSAAEAPSPKFVGLASDSRKLANIGTDSELWVVTIIRDPHLRDNGLPERVSVIYLTSKANPHKWHASFPEGTEFIVPLMRSPDGSYQTVYYRDETKPPKLY